MESTASPDLNTDIQQWRDSLATSPAFRCENLDELECHLRDSISILQSRGLASDEAFIIASRRIGKNGSLATEFAKVNSRALLIDRALWMLVGVQLWQFAFGIIHPAVLHLTSLSWRKWDSLHNRKYGRIPFVFIGVNQLLAFLLTLFVCWWLVSRYGERIARWLASLLNRRWTQTAAWLLCLVWIGLSGLSYFARSPGYATTESPSLNALSILIGPAVQIVAMMALTLTVARKHLRLNG